MPLQIQTDHHRRAPALEQSMRSQSREKLLKEQGINVQLQTDCTMTSDVMAWLYPTVLREPCSRHRPQSRWEGLEYDFTGAVALR